MSTVVEELADDEPSALTNRFLLDAHKEALERYEDRLKLLVREGEGEALVEVGLPIDDEYETKGLATEELDAAEKQNELVCAKLGCIATPILTRKCESGFSRVVLVRRDIPEKDFIEVRVATCGNVDAGKSSFIGVLAYNILDDGRGQARRRLFRHKHELESGRTSSVGSDILGFDARGKVVNHADTHSGRLDWTSISRSAAKLLTFIDLAGHERYLKTTIYGLTGHQPDYTMLIVGSNMGLSGMTKEHLSLCLSLNVPVFVVVTKIDRCPAPVLEETLKQLNRLLRSPGCRKLPINVHSTEDLFLAAQHFYTGRMCPLFLVSNVTGEGIDLVRTFLNILPLRRAKHDFSKVHFVIDEVFWVDGVGTVVSGNCLAGIVRVGDNLWLGPDSTGLFFLVPIKSIHRKRMTVEEVGPGKSAAFAIKKVTKRQIRKGMVLLSGNEQPHAFWEFEAEILILNHPTTISRNYEAMVHVGAVRQTAKIMRMAKDVLRTGDRDRVRFRFTRRPEYVQKGARLVFREGLTKAVGTVIELCEHATPINPAPTGRLKAHADLKRNKHKAPPPGDAQ